MMDTVTGSNNNKNQLFSTTSAAAVVKNAVFSPQVKQINQEKQLDVAIAAVPEDHQNINMEVAANPADLPAPGLVEKLMQQLNDLKEMVLYNIIDNNCNLYTLIS